MKQNKTKRILVPLKNLALVDTNTGEYFDLPTNKFELYQKKSTNTSTINSRSYVYFDTEEMMELLSLHNQENNLKIEIGQLALLTSYIQFRSNALLDANEEPLTAESIAKICCVTRRTVKNTFNSLVERGVLFYGKLESTNIKKKAYFVNPYLVRKGKEFYDEVISKFNSQVDLNKGLQKATTKQWKNKF